MKDYKQQHQVQQEIINRIMTEETYEDMKVSRGFSFTEEDEERKVTFNLTFRKVDETHYEVTDNRITRLNGCIHTTHTTTTFILEWNKQ